MVTMDGRDVVWDSLGNDVFCRNCKQMAYQEEADNTDLSSHTGFADVADSSALNH
jgi:hypothetical protein